MPYLCRSFSAKKPYSSWLICGKGPRWWSILWVFATLYLTGDARCPSRHFCVFFSIFGRLGVSIFFGVSLHVPCLCKNRCTLHVEHNTFDTCWTQYIQHVHYMLNTIHLTRAHADIKYTINGIYTMKRKRNFPGKICTMHIWHTYIYKRHVSTWPEVWHIHIHV